MMSLESSEMIAYWVFEAKIVATKNGPFENYFRHIWK